MSPVRRTLPLAPSPLVGEGQGGGYGGYVAPHERSNTPTPNPSPHPKSDVSDFGNFNMPNSGKPEFGWGGEQALRVARLCVHRASKRRLS